MGRRKPSIFSSTYREQVRRQRINIILIILILISAAYFGGKYYINKNNIKIFENSRISKMFQYIKDKAATQKGIGKEKETPPAKSESSSPQPQAPAPEPAPTAPEKKVDKFDFTLSSGKIISVEYTTLSDKREITGIKNAEEGNQFDISADKQRIVFEDKGSQDIITCDVNGNFVKLTLQEYVSKTSGEVVKKDYNQSRRPWYIWSQKPHFTMDGRVVYVSHLPYLKEGSGLYLWVVNLDGTGHRKVGKLSGDLSSISYEGYTEDGKLNINSGGTVYYLEQGSFALKK